jgi:hypothetical protein
LKILIFEKKIFIRRKLMPPKSLKKNKLVDVKKTIIKNPVVPVVPTAPVIITTKKPLVIKTIVADTPTIPELETIQPILSIGKLPNAPKYIEPPKDRPTLASQPTLEPTEENDSGQPKYIEPPKDRPTLASQPTLEPTEENDSGQPKYIEPPSDRATLATQPTLEPETIVEKFSMPFITKTLSGTYSTPIYVITEKYGHV